MVIADTSAWVWSRKPAYPQLWADFRGLLEEDDVATCDVVVVELLHAAQSADEFRRRRDQLAAMRRCPIREREWQRALDVMEELAHRRPLGHRAVNHQDLLIAAAAEAAGVAVLHYDEDYERIAAVTGQPVEWLAPKGSLR